MSVDMLTASGETKDVTNTAWAGILRFAQAYGWKPAGTIAPETWPESQSWEGSYDPAIGQALTAEDAAALGGAVKQGLADLDRSAGTEEFAGRFESAGFDDLPSPNDLERIWHILERFADYAIRSNGFRID